MKKSEILECLQNYSPSTIEEKQYKKQIISFIKENDIVLGKSNKEGHLTGSAWVVSKDRRKVLLTHHCKLDKWLQLGGHTEANEGILVAALREAKEESGLLSVTSLSEEVFDIDVHVIPSYKGDKEHIHYDIRFLFEADPSEKIKVSRESKDVKWIDIDKICLFSQEGSILRMVEKIYKLG